MSNVKELIDSILEDEYAKGQLIENDHTRLGYLQAIDTLTTRLNLTVSVEDIEDVLDQGHDAVICFNDGRIYRLDTVSENKPFIEPIPKGYGGKKRFVEGAKLNGLFPGVVVVSPNPVPKW